MSPNYEITLVLSVLAAPFLCALASDHPPSKPILTRLAKDLPTSLYTTSIKNGAPLVLDLAGPLVWSTCQSPHRKIPCRSSVCRVAKRNHPPNCPSTEGGLPGSDYEHCACSGYTGRRCRACTAYPYNPVNGQCGSGDLTAVILSANATDGKNPLFPVSFSAVASCARGGLLASLPSGAAGVAGLSRGPLSLPLQVAAKLKVERQFALCLPSGGDHGAAIFGGGPFSLQAAPPQQVSDRLRYTPLLKNRKNSAYYIGVTGIAVNLAQVLLPPGALALTAHQGQGGVALSTATPYTALRSDIYRPLLKAFDAATAGFARAPPSKPFDLCYQASKLPPTRIGLYTASIDLMLAGGQNWTFVGSSSVVEVNQDTACFAFVEMGSTPAVDQSPAVVIGGHQMEDNLVVFDLEKRQFGYSGLLLGTMTTCSNFNFSMGSHP